MKKTIVLMLLVCMTVLSGSLIPVSFASENNTNGGGDVCFSFDYKELDKDSQYAEWYCDDWNFDVDVFMNELSCSDIMIKKGTYTNYSLNFDIRVPRASSSNFTKSYLITRIVNSGFVYDENLGLSNNDLPTSDPKGRPGYMGVLLGFAEDEIEVIVHTFDDQTNSGYNHISAVVKLKEGVDFTQGVDIGIKDTENLIEIYAQGDKVASVTLNKDDSGENTKAEIIDADGSVMVSTERANVTDKGTFGFVCRKDALYIKKIEMRSLSGNGADSQNPEFFDHDSIHLKANPMIPAGDEKAEASLIVKICILMIIVILVGGVIACLFIMLPKGKVHIIASAIGGIVIIAAVVCFATGVFDKILGAEESIKIDPGIEITEDMVLDSKGNTVQVAITNADQRAQDALGRELPTYEEVGDTKPGKYVGVFYTLWTTSATAELNDNSRFLAQNPLNPGHGSVNYFHWWGEPEVGYADSSDPWVIRRNMYYLNMAGVDYIYLDFTNAGVYEEAFEVLLDTCLEMRNEGLNTPSIVPWCYGDDSGTYRDIGYLYRRYYSQEKYKGLWFYVDGKPLACLKRVEDNKTLKYGTGETSYLPALNNQALCDFFTFRFAWVPSESEAGRYPGEPVYRWSWNNPLFLHNYKADTYAYGWDEKEGVAEQATLIVGSHCAYDHGRSGKEGVLDQFNEKDTSGSGLFLQYQFDWLMENHPEVEYLNINGWNEWLAQYFPSLINTTTHCPFGFVDAYNREFSRDMEPMKGGYTDNYFYQLCSIIRQFKGMEPPADQDNKSSMDINGDLSQWDSMDGEYKDYYNDTTWRNDTDPTGKIKYVNETGRNDIISSKVAYDEGYIYFYAETAEEMTPYTDKNWMLLFIDGDDDPDTGWEGYDYLINYEVIDEGTTTICQYKDNIWQEIGVVSYKQSGKKLMIAVPRSLIGETGEDISFGFHWNDNVSNIYDIECWFLEGDNAPERRNMYIFSAKCKYSQSMENILPGRNDGDKISYMKALTDVDVNSLNSGLVAEKYSLTSNYGKQPEIWLLTNAYGTGGNLAWSGNKPTIALIEEKELVSYALSFEGYIWIQEDAEVTFSINSDDGAILYINDRVIVDNSGVHTAQSASNTIKLAAGLHKITLEYFENGNGGSTLDFSCNAKGYKFYY